MRRRRSDRNFNIHYFFCTQCGSLIPLPRTLDRLKEKGHLKKIYCTKCKKRTNHAEISENTSYLLEDFKLEFKLGRFSKEGKRIPLSDLIYCSKEDCPYNVDKLCWNGNNSQRCKRKKLILKGGIKK